MPFSRSRSIESMTRSVDLLVRPEVPPDWQEHGVDQGGLAVVDVGDDGDVAQRARAHGLPSSQSGTARCTPVGGGCPGAAERGAPSGYRLAAGPLPGGRA